MKRFVLLITTILLLSNCRGGDDHFSYFYQSPISEKKEAFIEVIIDTLKLDQISSSFNGFTLVQNDKIHFLDANFGWMFIFDTDGNLLSREMGQGHGPRELPMTGIQFFTLDDNGFSMLGSSNDFYRFDNDFNRTHVEILRWKRDHPTEYLARNPTPEAQRSYNLAYNISNMKVHGSFAYLPLYSAPPAYSQFYMFTDLYATDARILAEMNLDSGEIERIFGRFSPVYQQDERKRTFSMFDFDILNSGELVISFFADTLVHVFDLDFNHKRSFGFAGRYKSQHIGDLPDITNPDELGRHVFREVTSRDFYTTISCISERQLCFRSYRIASDDQHDGLQIYKENVLVADILVPQTGDHQNANYFQITGFSDTWLYSNIHFDESTEQKYIYRLQIGDL
ncbi:MAG: hypothetical protein LAT67_13790 [Balneolales bacterium]|nr:hypothetical protein [Balneolales bacterium]